MRRNGQGMEITSMESADVDAFSAQLGPLLEGLRAFGANYTEFTHRFAARLGLHATDAAALVEILYAEDKGVPLSPARLSKRISLSSGATTALINRLELAGHVVRTRDSSDRRIVTLRSSPAIRGPAEEFFAPFSHAVDALISTYPPSSMRQFEQFLSQLRTTMDSLLEEQYRDG